MRVTLLSIGQQRIAEEIAREWNVSCRSCGSSDLVSDTVARPLLGGSVKIDMVCADCGHDPSVILSLSAEEVEQRPQLDHNRQLPDFPEADGIGRAPTGY